MFYIDKIECMKLVHKLPRASFAQLRSFDAVARLGGITKAAQALMLTQPTVSTQMRELAEGLGVALLAPAGRGVRLTDAGHALLRTTTQLFDVWRNFEDEASSLRGMLSGSLRIAGVTTTEYFLAQWLKPFLASHPGIDVDLVVDNRDAIVKRLEGGADDLAVMMMPPAHLALERIAVMQNPLVVIGPAGHPWQHRRSVQLKLLDGADLLMREAGSGTRQAALDFFAARGITPRLRMALGSNEAVKHAVAAGLGLSVVSRHVLATDPTREGLCVLPVRGFPIQRDWYAVWRKDRRLPHVAAAFLSFVQSAEPYAMPLHGGSAEGQGLQA